MKPFLPFLLILLMSFASQAQSPMEEFTLRLADCYERNDPKCLTEALSLYVDIQKAAVGTEHEDYQSAVLALAMHLVDQEEFAEAQPYIREILLFTKAAKGPASEEVQQTGMLFLALLDFDESGKEKALLKEWLSEQFPGLPASHWEPATEENPERPETTPVEFDPGEDQSIDELLAILEQSHEGVYMDSDGAQASFERLIPLEEKIIEKMEKELQGRHPRYVEVLYLTANAYTYLAVNGDGTKEPQSYLLRSNILLDKALAHTEKIAGKQNEDYLLLLQSKGSNFAVAGDMEKYVAVMEESLSIMRGYLPKDDEMYQETLQIYSMLAPLYGMSPHKASDLKKAVEELDPETREEMPVYPDMLLFAGEQMEAKKRAESVISKMSFPNLLDSFLLFPGSRDHEQVLSFFETALKRLDPAFLSQLDDDASRQAMGFLQQEFEALASFVASAHHEFPELRGYLLRHVLQFSYLDQVRKERLRQRLLLKGNPKHRKLFNEWAAQKSKVNNLYEQAIYQKSGTKLDVFPEETRLKELEKQLSEAVDQTYSPPPAPDWLKIQSSLEKEEACVEIRRFIKRDRGAWTTEPAYLAFILRPDRQEPDLAFFPDAQTLDYPLFQAYQNSRFYGDDGTLYEAYFAPIRQRLEGVSRVYLSPDGVFHKINLNTLKVTGSDGYLLDQLDIQLTGSLLTLAREPMPDAVISSALLIGDPLFGAEPGDAESEEDAYFRSAGDAVISREMKWKPLPWSAVEVEKIAGLLEEKGISAPPFLRENAHKRHLAAHPGAGIVHLATHAWFSPLTDRMPLLKHIPFPESEDGNYPGLGGLLLDQEMPYMQYDSVQWDEETVQKIRSLNNGMWTDPRVFNPDLNSGIVFSGGDILTAFEIYGLDLQQTQLVVLSACNSGVSDLANGKGVAGLRGAFELAGANYIVNSLWEVKDDVAQTFMLYFYENWLGKGQSIRSAFRNAQFQIREEIAKQYPDQPRADLWGAFVLIDL